MGALRNPLRFRFDDIDMEASMKSYISWALALAFSLSFAAPVMADDDWFRATRHLSDDVQVFVVNHHDEDVRVFAERKDGRLFVVDRIRRGEAREITIPTAVLSSEYRLKIVRVPVDVWDPISDLQAIKTIPLNHVEMRRIVVWVDEDLSRSGVEVTER